MNVRSAIKTLTLAGAASVIAVPGVVLAAPSLGNWSASGGTISGCPSGATCTTLVSEDGFLQQQVELGGTTYFQTVVTDSGVTGNDANLDFASETFVEQISGGSANGGVLGRLTVNSVDGGGNGMTSQADLATGNFAGGSGAGILINQAVTDGGSSSTANDDFSSTLLLNRQLDTDGNQTGTDLALAQDVGLDLSGSQTGDFDKTSFALRRVSGSASDTAGSVTLPTGAGSTTTFGGTLSWAAGDDVIVTWVGQRISIDPNLLGTQFAGYQSVQNLGNGISAPPSPNLIDTFDFGGIDPGPWDWDSGSGLENTFGTAPSL